VCEAPQWHILRNSGVGEAGAINVELELVLLAKAGKDVHVLERQHAAAAHVVGVLDAEQPGFGAVRVQRANAALQFRQL
jgi:hypothetical protein